MTIIPWRLVLSALLLPVTAQTATAAEPRGQWLVADKVAEIRVVDCSGILWGFIAWEADPGKDAKNPDPAKRGRPTLGVPIILGMKPAGPDRWDGALYNPENGKTYTGGIRMSAGDALRVRGCVLGFLCGGETWMRAGSNHQDALPASDGELCTRAAERQ